jgi:hypothetical protein
LRLVTPQIGNLKNSEEITIKGEKKMSQNNLLISNFDRKIEHGLCFVAGVRIVERYSYIPIEGGYDETVIVEGNRERLREAVARGLDYAREHGLTVQVNNPLVWDDIEMGILDTTGLVVVVWIVFIG